MEGLAGEDRAPHPSSSLGRGGHVWKAGLKAGLLPHPASGGGEVPGLRLPARTDKGPLGAPTNGLSLGWGTACRAQERARAWSGLGVYSEER